MILLHVNVRGLRQLQSVLQPPASTSLVTHGCIKETASAVNFQQVRVRSLFTGFYRKKWKVLDNAVITLRSTAIKFDALWPLESPEQNKGTNCYMRFQSRHKPYSPGIVESDLHNFCSNNQSQSRPLSQSSIESIDQTHPPFHLYTRLRDSLSQYFPNIDLQNAVSSICSAAFQIVDTNSHRSLPDAIDLHGSRRRKGSTMASPDFSLIRGDYEQSKANEQSTANKQSKANAPSGDTFYNHEVYIGLGSNVGNCVENIELACKAMSDQGIFVHQTSFLYRTKPMYFENQHPFVNGVCKVI